jgi:hypothetical protein
LPFKCERQRYIEVTRAKLSLVDLAGSERQSATGGELCDQNTVDPQLESAWFQPMSL